MATEDAGLLLVRVVFGLLMAAHGSQKLFGWFDGHGLGPTGGMFESLGFRPGRLFAFAAGSAEFTGGLLVALGLLGPVGPALVLSVMTVAVGSVHLKNGLFAMSNGVEVPLLYAAAVSALALTGPGQYSADATFAWTAVWTPALTLIVLAVGFVGGVGNLGLRRATVAA